MREQSRNCAQGTLCALREGFKLAGGEELLNAAMFLPGVGSRTEAGGAFLDGPLAHGLGYGRCNLGDPSHNSPASDAEMLSIRPGSALRYCEAFGAAFGSKACGVIRPPMMGRDYDNLDPEDRRQFIADDGHKKCRVPTETAARIAARYCWRTNGPCEV